MLKAAGNIITPEIIPIELPADGLKRKIIDIMIASSEEYSFKSLEQLKFEADMRNSIVNAARELDKGPMSFRIFRNSKCNPDFWERTNEGGFLTRKDIKPSDAIKDIFIHGSKYGTECATAMVIVYFKALVDLYPESLFNTAFPSIQLMNWHYDSDLHIRSCRHPNDQLPGDCRYFKNPDVNPLTPQWQGENTIDLGDGTYYGHGIGIKNKEKVVESLNKRRKVGATADAYLMESATCPDFRYLGDLLINYNPQPVVQTPVQEMRRSCRVRVSYS